MLYYVLLYRFWNMDYMFFFSLQFSEALRDPKRR